MTQMLSPHFSLGELTHSDTAIRRGIDQTPPPVVLNTLMQTAQRMEQVRSLLGHPVRITSGYRSAELNRAVGGATSSAHLTGHAVDFVCPDFGTPKDIARFLAEKLTNFDQIIQEGTWVHIAFGPRLVLRNELLTAHFGPSGVTYTKGLT